MKTFFTFLMLLFVLFSAKAQEVQPNSNIWYFGYNAGLDFNTTPPTPLLNSQLSTQEGVASIADNNGKLLFYTDGRNVWDRSHQLMPQGDDVLSGSYTSTQTAIIVPNLSNPSLYYIFTTGAGHQAKLSYSTVDISLAGNGSTAAPLGDLISSEIDIEIATGVCEKLTAIVKPSNTGYWVLAHGFSNTIFYAINITCNGVKPTTINSDVGSLYFGSFHEAGYMRSTPDGKKLALINSSERAVFVYDFNTVTGEVSNEKKINPNNDEMYGIEFSNSGRYLYIGEPQKISRYDLTNSSLTDVPLDNPQILSSSNKFKALQMGPNGSIYIAVSNRKFLSTIVNPEGLNPNIKINGISLAGSSPSWGLPDIFYKYLHPVDSLTLNTCANTPIAYEGVFYEPNSINEIMVPSDIGCDSSLLILTVDTLVIMNTYLDVEICEGTYYDYNGIPVLAGTSQTFIHTDEIGCDSLVTINVASVEFVERSIDTLICANTIFHFDNQDFYPGTDTIVQVQVSNDCDTIVHLVVNGLGEITYDLYSFKSCWNQPSGSIIQNAIKGGTPPYQFSLDGSNYQSIQFDNIPGQEYTHWIKDSNGCIYTQEISVEEYPPIVIEQPPTLFPCAEDSVLVAPTLLSGDIDSLVWSWPDGSSDSQSFFSAPGTYPLQISNQCEVLTQDILIVNEEREILNWLYIPEIFSPNGDGINDTYQLGISDNMELLEIEFKVFDRWGGLVFSSKDVSQSWNGKTKNVDALQGVYGWTLSTTISDCRQIISEKRTGALTIIR